MNASSQVANWTFSSAWALLPGLMIRKQAIRAGATPKETVSAIESNSAPNNDSRRVARATRPSKRSQRHAPRMNQTAHR